MGGKPTKIAQDNTEESVTPRKSPIGEAWPNDVDLPKPLTAIIRNYHANDFDVSGYSYPHCLGFTLFQKTAQTAFRANKIGTDALHGRRNAAYTTANSYPDSLLAITKAQDPYGRYAEGTPLQLAAAGGDYLLVRKLRKLMTREEAEVQLSAQFPEGWQDETTARMQKYYLTPLIQFANQLKKTFTSGRSENFEKIKHFYLEDIRQFRAAIKPQPTDPTIKTGLLFDPSVLIKADNLIQKHLREWIGGCFNHRHDLLLLVYQSLIGASSAFNAQIWLNGEDNFFQNNVMPGEALRFSTGQDFFSNDLSKGIGMDFSINHYGYLQREVCLLNYNAWNFDKLLSVQNTNINKLMWAQTPSLTHKP